MGPCQQNGPINIEWPSKIVHLPDSSSQSSSHLNPSPQSIAWQEALDISSPKSVESPSPSSPLDCLVQVPVTSSAVVWRRTKNGKFSEKSTYSLLVEIEAREVASSSRTSPTSVANPGKLWRCLWSLPVPPRVKVLGWKICSEAVPTLEKLARQHRDVDTRCAVCGAASETVKHIFLECQFARLAWVVSNFPWRVVADWREGAAGWLLRGLEYGETQDKAWFVTMCWALWKHRNSRLVEGKVQEAGAVVKEAALVLS
ncbi:hypothetical protein Salat_2128100 [Sesamum alatum]|uniref:Reverse transcriptase zinc-binding domain-containing protein n=1 Tax=Sesamum alatum TaxID=300844 RepID=A0AAE2CH18_9LAMI|nr:hypothetical protein Salat_2128100 [Sesamum alatum]